MELNTWVALAITCGFIGFMAVELILPAQHAAGSALSADRPGRLHLLNCGRRPGTVRNIADIRWAAHGEPLELGWLA